jgi:integrase
MCPPWVEGAHAGAPLQVKDLLTSMSATWYEPVGVFKIMVRELPIEKVFTCAGQQIAAIKKAFKPACQRAGIENFTCHDLGNTAINNWRLQGHDYFRIMAATGHKTMTVFHAI